MIYHTALQSASWREWGGAGVEPYKIFEPPVPFTFIVPGGRFVAAQSRFLATIKMHKNLHFLLENSNKILRDVPPPQPPSSTGTSRPLRGWPLHSPLFSVNLHSAALCCRHAVLTRVKSVKPVRNDWHMYSPTYLPTLYSMIYERRMPLGNSGGVQRIVRWLEPHSSTISDSTALGAVHRHIV